MAAITGANGSVTFATGAATAIIKQWEIEDSADFEDITGAATGATGRRAKAVTLTDWKGTFEGIVDSTDAKFKGATPSIRSGSTGSASFITGGTGPGITTSAMTYSGTILVTNVKIANVVDGVVTYNVTFEGNGALSYPS